MTHTASPRKLSKFHFALAMLLPVYPLITALLYLVLPLTEGWTAGGEHDPLWLPVAIVAAWTVIFAMVAVLGVRRSRART